MATATNIRNSAFRFPVGFYHLHDDVSLNWQMNRWFNWVGDESMLDEMRSIAPRIRTYADWKREFLGLADTALARNEILKAAYYFRSAAFFMLPSDPDMQPTRRRFVELAQAGYGLGASDEIAVPYRDAGRAGTLPGYRFTPANPKGTLLLFGGYDGYIEELVPMGRVFRDAGFDAVLFEGPGQGRALEESGLPMTHEWEKPVATLLDHLGLVDVSLMGVSLGGYLAIRAAAFEPRIQRVIADDVIYDFLATSLHQESSAARFVLNAGIDLDAAPVVNEALGSAARKSFVTEWGVQQGMHVMGAASPYEYLKLTKRYTAAEISKLVKQDVLLLAGSRDHFVPVEMLYKQIQALPNVRSLTARLFTEADHAQEHIQVGNIGLSLQVIVDWLDRILASR